MKAKDSVVTAMSLFCHCFSELRVICECFLRFGTSAKFLRIMLKECTVLDSGLAHFTFDEHQPCINYGVTEHVAAVLG